MHEHYLSMPAEDELPLPVDGINADGRAIFFLVKESNPDLLAKLFQARNFAKWLNDQGWLHERRQHELLQTWLAGQPSGVAISKHQLRYAQLRAQEEASSELTQKLQDVWCYWKRGAQ